MAGEPEQASDDMDWCDVAEVNEEVERIVRMHHEGDVMMERQVEVQEDTLDEENMDLPSVVSQDVVTQAELLTVVRATDGEVSSERSLLQEDTEMEQEPAHVDHSEQSATPSVTLLSTEQMIGVMLPDEVLAEHRQRVQEGAVETEDESVSSASEYATAQTSPTRTPDRCQSPRHDLLNHEFGRRPIAARFISPNLRQQQNVILRPPGVIDQPVRVNYDASLPPGIVRRRRRVPCPDAVTNALQDACPLQ